MCSASGVSKKGVWGCHTPLFVEAIGKYLACQLKLVLWSLTNNSGRFNSLSVKFFCHTHTPIQMLFGTPPLSPLSFFSVLLCRRSSCSRPSKLWEPRQSIASILVPSCVVLFHFILLLVYISLLVFIYLIYIYQCSFQYINHILLSFSVESTCTGSFT